MTVADALLLALGAIATGSGAFVVTSSHLVRAGLYLVVSLGAMAGMFLVLGAELVAWVQVLVYVGAVVVLLLFAVMLTRAPIGPSRDLDRPAGPAAIIGAGVGTGLAVLFLDAFRWTIHPSPTVGTAERMGRQIFGGWVLPFEVISILLLAALVGAIVLSRPDIGARTDPEAQPALPEQPTPPATDAPADPAQAGRADATGEPEAQGESAVRTRDEQRAESAKEPAEPGQRPNPATKTQPQPAATGDDPSPSRTGVA